MYQHMILMCSDYTLERRMAFYKTYCDVLSALEFQGILQEIKGDFRNVEFSFHHIETDKPEIESVAEYDSYFEDVKFYAERLEFIESVEKSIEVTPTDIAKYILTKKSFDQLQIQKLIYFIYLEYIRMQDKFLFKDTFKAWQYGPVIPSLYYKLRKYGYSDIQLKDKELEKVRLELKLSRSCDKKDIIECIDHVIDMYGEKTGGELIDITHKKGGPWDKTCNLYGERSEIPPQLIKQYAMETL